MNDFTIVTRHIVMSEHLNPNGTLFGGQLLAWLDSDLAIFACEHAKYKSLVTASMDNVKFKAPGRIGDVVKIYAKILEVKPHYLLIKGKAVAHNVETGEERVVIECDIQMVAVDESGRLIRKFVPEKSLIDQLIIGTDAVISSILKR